MLSDSMQNFKKYFIYLLKDIFIYIFEAYISLFRKKHPPSLPKLYFIFSFKLLPEKIICCRNIFRILCTKNYYPFFYLVLKHFPRKFKAFKSFLRNVMFCNKVFSEIGYYTLSLRNENYFSLLFLRLKLHFFSESLMLYFTGIMKYFYFEITFFLNYFSYKN